MKERTSWRDVPMPDTIARLPRSDGGLPVPYVAQWEGEEHMTIRPCPYAIGQLGVFPTDPEAFTRGRPVFGIMEPSRQREVCMAVKCQVCRGVLDPMTEELVPTSSIHWLVDMLREPKTMRGHKLALEPWVCDDCLVYALQVCPGLIGSKTPFRSMMVDKRVAIKNVLAVWTANVIAVTVHPGGNLKGKAPCLGYHKIEPLLYTRLSAVHLLSYGPAEIRDMLDSDFKRGMLEWQRGNASV